MLGVAVAPNSPSKASLPVKKSLFAILAIALVGLLAGCDSNPSGSDPQGSVASSPVGTWSQSDASSKTILTIGSDGSYSKVVSTTMGGASSYQKMSGTWTAHGDSLDVRLTRSEASIDGSKWTGADLPAPIATTGSFLVNGKVLSITIAGVETRYVQGSGGVVPEEAMEAPAISPAGGSFASAQTVAIAALNAGAEIRYTLDGSTPSANSSLYSGSLQVSATTTVKAVAIKNGKSGPVASATFIIQGGGNSGSTELVGSWVNSDADGATTTFAFGADGGLTILVIDPNAPDAYRYDRTTGTWSTSETKLTVKLAKEENSSDMSNWTASGDFAASTENATFTVSGSKLTLDYGSEAIVYVKAGGTTPATVSAPIITPDGGSYTTAQTVAIVSATAGASVYYTLDGSTPTKNSTPLTSGTLTVSSSETIKAIAILEGKSSTVTSATFTIQTSSSPADALVGSWGVSAGSYQETDKFNADGTFTIIVSDPSASQGFSYLRISGTYTVTGNKLVRTLSKWETSDDGSSWTSSNIPGSDDSATWSVSGTKLKLVDSEGNVSEYTKR